MLFVRHGKMWALLFLVLSLNFATWLYVRDTHANWINVPPAPSWQSASFSGIGDTQFSYRMIAIMLQNLGDTGGRSTALKDYDYEELVRWFYVQNKLDPHSDFIPFLGAFYFGAVQLPDKLAPLIEYLRVIGHSAEGEKWRWLAQAVYLARFKMGDLDLAYSLAQELASIEKEDMPGWTKQMPAFILNAKGDKETAYAMLIELLKSSAQDMHPNEVNFTRDYICTRILEPSKAQANPICQDIP